MHQNKSHSMFCTVYIPYYALCTVLLKLVADGPTDRPTDRPTDIVKYRAAIAAKNSTHTDRGSPFWVCATA